jgi:hypothetical protein
MLQVDLKVASSGHHPPWSIINSCRVTQERHPKYLTIYVSSSMEEARTRRSNDLDYTLVWIPTETVPCCRSHCGMMRFMGWFPCHISWSPVPWRGTQGFAGNNSHKDVLRSYRMEIPDCLHSKKIDLPKPIACNLILVHDEI